LACISHQLDIGSEISSFYIEVIKMGLLPIAVSLIAAAMWYTAYVVCYKESLLDIKCNLEVTVFVILYLTYPTITNMSFSLFNCQELENGRSYMVKDFSVECWTGTHLSVAVPVGIVFILVWVVGFPVFAFMKLYRNRHNLNDRDVILNYGLFFVGLSDQAYYWEVVLSNLRKVVFVTSSTLLPAKNPVFKVSNRSLNYPKVCIGVAGMIVQMQLLHFCVPYIDPRFNDLERQGIYASVSFLNL
jgi:hypothetical protein